MFARFRDVNPLPFPRMYAPETFPMMEMLDGRRALSNVPSVNKLAFDVPPFPEATIPVKNAPLPNTYPFTVKFPWSVGSLDKTTLPVPVFVVTPVPP